MGSPNRQNAGWLMGNAESPMSEVVVKHVVRRWSVAVVVVEFLIGRRLLYHCQLDKTVGFREDVDVVGQNAVSNRHGFATKSK